MSAIDFGHVVEIFLFLKVIPHPSLFRPRRKQDIPAGFTHPVPPCAHLCIEEEDGCSSPE